MVLCRRGTRRAKPDYYGAARPAPTVRSSQPARREPQTHRGSHRSPCRGRTGTPCESSPCRGSPTGAVAASPPIGTRSACQCPSQASSPPPPHGSRARGGGGARRPTASMPTRCGSSPASRCPSGESPLARQMHHRFIGLRSTDNPAAGCAGAVPERKSILTSVHNYSDANTHIPMEERLERNPKDVARQTNGCRSACLSPSSLGICWILGQQGPLASGNLTVNIVTDKSPVYCKEVSEFR